MTTIQKDSVARIHYKLTLDDGSVADNSFDGEPLAYLHGHGNIVPGLERQLEGKTAADANIIIRSHQTAPGGRVRDLISRCQDLGFEQFVLRVKEELK